MKKIIYSLIIGAILSEIIHVIYGVNQSSVNVLLTLGFGILAYIILSMISARKNRKNRKFTLKK